MTITFPEINGTGEIYLDCLKAICGEAAGKSMLDLCCAFAPHTCQLGFRKRTYVDILPRVLNDKNEQKYFIQADIFDILKSRDYFVDVCIISDGIEHVTKHNGLFLIEEMKAISDKQIVFTPLGSYMVEFGDNPENHHSGWMPEELDGFANIVFPVYHPTLTVGAFFSWHCDNIEQDFQRVINELKQKEWARQSLEHYS